MGEGKNSVERGSVVDKKFKSIENVCDLEEWNDMFEAQVRIRKRIFHGKKIYILANIVDGVFLGKLMKNAIKTIKVCQGKRFSEVIELEMKSGNAKSWEEAVKNASRRVEFQLKSKGQIERDAFSDFTIKDLSELLKNNDFFTVLWKGIEIEQKIDGKGKSVLRERMRKAFVDKGYGLLLRKKHEEFIELIEATEHLTDYRKIIEKRLKRKDFENVSKEIFESLEMKEVVKDKLVGFKNFADFIRMKKMFFERLKIFSSEEVGELMKEPTKKYLRCIMEGGVNLCVSTEEVLEESKCWIGEDLITKREVDFLFKEFVEENLPKTIWEEVESSLGTHEVLRLIDYYVENGIITRERVNEIWKKVMKALKVTEKAKKAIKKAKRVMEKKKV